MERKTIIFDLDGTLTDSGEGIMQCAAVAFAHFGLPVPSPQELRYFVGPPLERSFPRFGIPEEKIPEAIAVFRKRYTTVGKYENFLYPGIPELLQKLREAGHRLLVATSKPEVMALDIMAHFGIAEFFDTICGADLDLTRTSKEAVLRYLMDRTQVSRQALMVGDTVFDVEGAATVGLSTVGVTWGYGEEADLRKAGAVAVAHDARELLTILNR